MSKINCTSYIFGAAPFKEMTTAGIALSIAKRIVIGVIITTALATGIYFAKMAIYNNWNVSIGTKMGLAISSACIIGIISLIPTAASVSVAYEQYAK